MNTQKSDLRKNAINGIQDKKRKEMMDLAFKQALEKKMKALRTRRR